MELNYQLYSTCYIIVGIPEPSLDMYENIMLISQIMVQAMWRPFETLEQLPHINDRKLVYHKKVICHVH